MTVEAAESYVRGTFARLDEWRGRSRLPFHPDAGTDLAADDLDWPPSRVSQVAASSTVAAIDHLQAFRVHVEAGELFSFAHPTLLRTALLASAQAVWVLAPEGPHVRTANARTLAVHLNAEHVKFLNDLQSLPPEGHAGTDAVAAHAAARLNEVRPRPDDLSAVRSVAPPRQRWLAEPGTPSYASNPRLSTLLALADGGVSLPEILTGPP